MVPFERLGVVSYSPSIITMAISLTVYEIFSVKNSATSKRSPKVIQTATIQKLGCGFLFTFDSNYGHIFNRL